VGWIPGISAIKRWAKDNTETKRHSAKNWEPRLESFMKSQNLEKDTFNIENVARMARWKLPNLIEMRLGFYHHAHSTAKSATVEKPEKVGCTNFSKSEFEVVPWFKYSLEEIPSK